jgi:hypothetical protein
MCCIHVIYFICFHKYVCVYMHVCMYVCMYVYNHHVYTHATQDKQTNKQTNKQTQTRVNKLQLYLNTQASPGHVFPVFSLEQLLLLLQDPFTPLMLFLDLLNLHNACGSNLSLSLCSSYRNTSKCISLSVCFPAEAHLL